MSDINVRTLANTNLPRLNPLLLPLPWLVVIALVIIFMALKYSGKTQTAVDEENIKKEFPQIFISNVEMREFSADGSLHYQLKTPLIRHFQADEKPSDKDYTLFDLPQIVFLGNEQKPGWYITAQVGRNDTNGDLFTLSNDVLAQQTSHSHGVVSITTTELHLNTREQFAETDKTVTMRAAKGEVSAEGMRADIKQERITLASKVKGSYEP